MNARVAGAVNEVVDAAPLIVTATSSRTPVLSNRVRDDAFIAAVGAFTPEMAELPADLVRRCRCFADTLEGAKSEAGDFIQAGIDWETVTPLAAALSQQPPHSGPVLFKSVGHAMFDLAAAGMAFG
jgi:1-piperideine-2-carboxylate/1-pyrroline-2-carboxylate reductase [NAD(P)H]